MRREEQINAGNFASMEGASMENPEHHHLANKFQHLVNPEHHMVNTVVTDLVNMAVSTINNSVIDSHSTSSLTE